jgi:hypothetical protein
MAFISHTGLTNSFELKNKTAKSYYDYGAILQYHHVNTATPAVTSISPDLFKQHLNLIESEGFTMDEVTATFTGQILFMVDGVTTITEMVDYGYGDPFESKETTPLVGAAFGIKDKVVFSKLGESMDVNANGVMEIEDGYYACVLENVFFTSNDSLWINLVATNNSKKLKDEQGNLKEQPLAFFMNFNSSDYQKALDMDLPVSDVFENAWGYANLGEAELNLIMKDKSQNSLRVMVKLVADYLADEEIKANEDMKDIIEQEVLESLEIESENIEKGLDIIGDAIKDIDVDKAVEDVLKNIGN